MNTTRTEVKAPEIPTRFRGVLARLYSEAALWGTPICPLHGERRTVAGRTYAIEEIEAGGFKVESGKAKWNLTFTDLDTGRGWTVMGAWATTRRAKDGSVRHRYSHKSVGAFGTWADLVTALITQRQQVQGVAA